eukprot:5281384-Alexandrium_andersonii.AAC.1
MHTHKHTQGQSERDCNKQTARKQTPLPRNSCKYPGAWMLGPPACFKPCRRRLACSRAALAALRQSGWSFSGLTSGLP